MSAVHPDRVRLANEQPFREEGTHIVYWMQAAQRVHENPALAYAIELANKHSKQLVVCFGVTSYPSAQKAQYDFMLEGLRDVAEQLAKRKIEFVCKEQDPVELVLSFNAAAIVTDENYVRVPRQWRERLAQQSPAQVFIVDANLVVPVWLRGKEEYAAYTIRPKLWADAPKFLVPTQLPALKRPATNTTNQVPKLTLPLQDEAKRPQGLTGGERAALAQLSTFLERLENYEHHSDPTKNGTSMLSAHLHFGHISPVTIVNAVSAAAATKPAVDTVANAFIEQVFIRREVAHNFTYYNEHYDSFAGLPSWAQKTLNEHRNDPRAYTYTYEELRDAKTHDDLWNAAQNQMRATGYMHNYLRMLWAKKILEWSATPEEALATAIKLNDTYELDGRDANGYTGIAWSIGGKHDRPWFQRAVYGQIRYMSSDAAKKKFDAKQYIAAHSSVPY